MAARPVSPGWWPDHPDGLYWPSFWDAEDAAALVGLHGSSATIRTGPKAVAGLRAPRFVGRPKAIFVAVTILGRTGGDDDSPIQGRDGLGCDS